MKMRRGISPVLATVLIIAATLVAAAAIIGYVFFMAQNFNAPQTTTTIQLTETMPPPPVKAVPSVMLLSCNQLARDLNGNITEGRNSGVYGAVNAVLAEIDFQAWQLKGCNA